ncbi:MAG: diaminopimelate epimerase, partial [Myxococcales bacterium]|nr:diaminopimelate epimerase [Myxococcales bacterium]
MSGMQFIKMSGSGNDFIFFDGRMVQRGVEEWQALARKLCRRGLSVGADGLVVLQPVEDHPEVQFEWLFLNADGSEAEMCGNAGRCAAHVAWKTRLVSEKKMAFMTLAGVIHAELTERGAKVQLTDPTDLRPEMSLALKSGAIPVGFVNTGVPHAVWFVEDAGTVDVKTWGREVRFHDDFKPAGTNANVAEVLGPDEIRIRTYERGVEDETLACG